MSAAKKKDREILDHIAVEDWPMANFDRKAAVEYAKKYALTPNAKYPPFPNDCTSFVSQVMLAGGWAMIGGSFGDRQGNNVWWWGKSILSQASYTWGGAHNFSLFLAASGRAKRCARADVRLADIIQIAENGHVFHTMVVTGETGPLLSYHSTNTLDKELSKIEPSYTAKKYSFLYWKLKDPL